MNYLLAILAIIIGLGLPACALIETPVPSPSATVTVIIEGTIAEPIGDITSGVSTWGGSIEILEGEIITDDLTDIGDIEFKLLD